MGWFGRLGRREDQGSALVEAALVVPLLFMLLLGIWSTGRAYNIYLTIDHAAREAARFGAVFDGTDPNAWRDQVIAKAIDEAQPSLTLAIADVCASLVDGPSNTVTDCLDNSDDPRVEKRGQVTIQSDIPMNFLFFSFDVTVSSKAIARWEAGST